MVEIDKAPQVADVTERPSGQLDVRAVIERGTFTLDVAFTVLPGEILGVIGPNGAGKTTLLRALAGLTSLTEGHIRLGDTVLDEPSARVFLPPEKRPVGLVFQNYRLFPHLSVRSNVAFSPIARGAGRNRARQIADDWLHRLNLTELADRRPGQLSGGQAQRVALARALAAHPALLLLDEPMAALDARTRSEVRAELGRHLSAYGGPTLLVTHDPLEAMVMASRLLVIEHGVAVQEGTPAQVARRPATQYVARLVGLNLYAGTTGEGTTVDLDNGGTFSASPLCEDLATAREGPRRVLVAVRPTAIAIHTSRPSHASPRNVWPGTVRGLELLTDRVRVQVAGTPDALIDITADALADLGLIDGLPVWLSAKATEIDVYPNPR
ncbi:MAG TPA: ABC transporter ATP-binding protein [Jatrophihabitans sp.]|jgi:molybdate transport system ATP-binding protein